MNPTDRQSIKKILLIRTDRIGDVVLSLPMLPLLKKEFPSASISVMVRSYTKELVETHTDVSEVMLWDENNSLLDYVKVLKEKDFDLAILPYPRFNLALITFLSGIRIRVGTGYRWYSFLFNKKIYEHRKDAKRHEVEYNLNLLKAIGIESNEVPQFEFTINRSVKKKIEDILTSDGIDTSKLFVVLHAGSGGSARDWKIEKFAELGDLLQSTEGFRVVLTGSKSEEKLIGSLVTKMKTKPLNYTGRFSLQELGALFQRASVFVANSTGPLHIASIVGTPVVAFYPPIIQCGPMRWGPYTTKKKVFSADNKLCTLCNGGVCQSNICMDQISVEQVVSGIKELINEKK
ncbi:MAG: glycosyltransferase family 9 protein [Bacteroidota bacterium]|nr:glycosyltransferase family 9 protein [Bacteroidota bacterium]